MICGVYEKIRSDNLHPELIRRMLNENNASRGVNIFLDGAVGLGSLEVEPQPNYESKLEPTNKPGQTICVAWQGEIYNRADLLQYLGFQLIDSPRINSHELFLKLYEAYGYSFLERVNGRFAFAIYDGRKQETILGRDRLGIETLYYYEDSKNFVFSSRIAPILAHPDVKKELNLQALWRYLVFNYNPAWDTFFYGIKKVRPGSLVILKRNSVSEKRYWFLSFQRGQEKSVSEHSHNIRELMRDALRLRIQPPDSLGIFLSGGMDSSSVAGLTHDLSDRSFSTFTYRTSSKSLDESTYARIMAKYCGSEHHDITYNPADICKMESVVELMDEPFCNVGIIIATFLLGQAAQGKASRVFSGDGGDELFGGHPVYTADKIAAVFEKIPSVLRSPLTELLRWLPDTDQKLSPAVKLKRFSESMAYPKELDTNRWRIYYGCDDLSKLLNQNFSTTENLFEPLFADVLRVIQEADGPDNLSRSLYVDFQTELSFSLRRMDILRHFQIMPCFPLLDHRLVEYAATIPAHLKIRGLSDTKYIQRRAMEGVLPDEIVHREDKLGHSIPFKNWLRSEPIVKGFVKDVLSEGRLNHRGLVNSKYVDTLWKNHQNLRQNNSHRLWALTVLELWLTKNNL